MLDSIIERTFVAGSNKSSHQIIKEAVAAKFNSNAFDDAFEIARKAGEEFGQHVYEKCLARIIVVTKMDPIWVQRLLTESIYYGTQSDVAIRLAPYNPKDLIV